MLQERAPGDLPRPNLLEATVIPIGLPGTTIIDVNRDEITKTMTITKGEIAGETGQTVGNIVIVGEVAADDQ